MTSIFRSIVHSSFRRSIQIGSFVQQVLSNTWVFRTTTADFTFTRAGDQYGIDSSGDLVLSTTDVSAHVFGEGILLEAARTNLLERSEDLNDAVWTKRGTLVVTTNDATAPDGTVTADKIEGLNTGTNDIFQLMSTFSSDVSYAPSIYVKRISTTGEFNFQNPADNLKGRWLVDMSLLPDAWVRLDPSLAAVTEATSFSSAGTSGGVHIQGAAGGSLSMHVWSAQAENNVTFPSSRIKTLGATATRSATSMTRAWDFPANGITGQIKPTVNFDEADDKGSDVLLFEASDGTADNYLRITFDQTNDQIHLTKKVSGGAEVVASTIATNLNYTDGDQLNIRFRANDSDGISLEVEGETRVDVGTGDGATDWATLMDQIELHPAFVAVESLHIWNESKSDAFLEALT